MITSWPLNVASASGVPPYRIDRHQHALHESSNVKSHSHSWELTNWWKQFEHLALRPSTASKYSSKLARLRLPNSHDHSLQLHISKLARSRPPTLSPNSLDYGLQLCPIMAPKSIYKIAWSRPPSASPDSLNHSVQVYLEIRCITASKFAWSWHPSSSPNSPDHGLRVYIGGHSIIIVRRTSNCTQVLPAASQDIPCVGG